MNGHSDRIGKDRCEVRTAPSKVHQPGRNRHRRWRTTTKPTRTGSGLVGLPNGPLFSLPTHQPLSRALKTHKHTRTGRNMFVRARDNQYINQSTKPSLNGADLCQVSDLDRVLCPKKREPTRFVFSSPLFPLHSSIDNRSRKDRKNGHGRSCGGWWCPMGI